MWLKRVLLCHGCNWHKCCWNWPESPSMQTQWNVWWLITFLPRKIVKPVHAVIIPHRTVQNLMAIFMVPTVARQADIASFPCCPLSCMRKKEKNFMWTSMFLPNMRERLSHLKSPATIRKWKIWNWPSRRKGLQTECWICVFPVGARNRKFLWMERKWQAYSPVLIWKYPGNGWRETKSASFFLWWKSGWCANIIVNIPLTRCLEERLCIGKNRPIKYHTLSYAALWFIAWIWCGINSFVMMM